MNLAGVAVIRLTRQPMKPMSLGSIIAPDDEAVALARDIEFFHVDHSTASGSW
jgi:hypothetical protein